MELIDETFPDKNRLSPISIAALKGDLDDVILIAAFELWRRGFLRINGKGAEIRIQGVLPGDRIIAEPVQEVLWRYAQTPRRPYELFTDPSRRAIRILLDPIYTEFYRLKLLRRPAQRYLLGAGVMAAFAGIIGAVVAGLTMGISMILFLLSTLVLILLLSRPFRLTRLGQNYLEHLKQPFLRITDKANPLFSEKLTPAMGMAVLGKEFIAGFPFLDVFSNAFGITARKFPEEWVCGCGVGYGAYGDNSR